MKKHILIVFGTRPEAIKMAPVVKELQRRGDEFRVSVCATGQHREMLDQVLVAFGIRPDHDLRLMQAGQDLYDLSARVLTGMRAVLQEAGPDMVLVHGDTTTSAMAALAAYYRQLPVAHVEAGLRTDNLYSPFPEEMNRRLNGTLCTLHFAPTQQARLNLLREGVADSAIHVTGNTVIDALQWAVGNRLTIDPHIGTHPRKVLVTGHRRENMGDGIVSICHAIARLAELFPDVDFIYPVHLNPNIQQPVRQLLGSGHPNVHLPQPMPYFEFLGLMERCHLVLTDSGGLQEEAPALGKPVLVMRDTTERPEAIEAGVARLVGSDARSIEEHVARLLTDDTAYHAMATAANPFGDGHAARRIADVLANV